MWPERMAARCQLRQRLPSAPPRIQLRRIPIALDEYDGAAIVRRFAAAITAATRVISVRHVISSTGLRMPIAEISALARERGVLCVVDGAQA
jgi:selenocysteine lyase/cysteine desulfurase